VVEHKDRATRFGCRYIETLLSTQGRSLEIVNQAENSTEDLLADLQSKLAKIEAKRHTSHHLERLTNKRTRKIDHYLHTASRRIIDVLVSEGIGTLVIGYNADANDSYNIIRKGVTRLAETA